MESKKEYRKVYTKKGSNSLIFNIPKKFADYLKIERGDYLKVTIEEDFDKSGVYIKISKE